MEDKSELTGEMTLELAAYLLHYSLGEDNSVPWKSDGHSILEWGRVGEGEEKIRNNSFHCEH